jgi:hypothetical protein
MAICCSASTDRHHWFHQNRVSSEQKNREICRVQFKNRQEQNIKQIKDRLKTGKKQAEDRLKAD